MAPRNINSLVGSPRQDWGPKMVKQVGGIVALWSIRFRRDISLRVCRQTHVSAVVYSPRCGQGWRSLEQHVSGACKGPCLSACVLRCYSCLACFTRVRRGRVRLYEHTAEAVPYVRSHWAEFKYSTTTAVLRSSSQHLGSTCTRIPGGHNSHY